MVGDAFSGLKRMWIDMYRMVSNFVYKNSDIVTTLFSGNKNIQVEAGVDPEKIVIIPNGINTAKYEKLRPVARKKDNFIVALIGRVVPIKDITTFILAARNVIDIMPKGVSFEVLGPFCEDEDYVYECFSLRNLLDLENSLSFRGKVNVMEFLPKIDVMVLTSISEGLPLSVLEAMSAGIPCVTTNVGACPDLLLGKDEEDRGLGECGIIVNVHSPHETADAIVRLISNPELYGRMSETGKMRTKKYYEHRDIMKMYRKIISENFLETL